MRVIWRYTTIVVGARRRFHSLSSLSDTRTSPGASELPTDRQVVHTTTRGNQQSDAKLSTLQDRSFKTSIQ